MNVYVTEYGAKVGFKDNTVYVEKEDNIIAQYPAEKIETITIFSSSQITSQCIEKLSKNDVDISWITSTGKLIGCLTNLNKQDVLKQKNQFRAIENNEFCLEMSKRIITAKIHNQRVFLYRMNETDKYEAVDKIINDLKNYKGKCETAKSIEEIGGLEGISARIYFEGLRNFIPEKYKFEKRTKRPPTDYASALLGFAYSLLFNDMLLAIQNSGLNPFVGVMHKLKQGHPALVSDLIEEFRPIAADAIVMDFIKNSNPNLEDFTVAETGAIYIDRANIKKILNLYENKMHGNISYVKREGFKNDFRTSYSIQTYEFIEAINSQDAKMYNPIILR